MGVELLSSEKAFEGKVFDVRIDQVRLANGHETRIDIVEHAGAVTFIPVDDEGEIWFVRQYRHATGRELLELPAGTLEAGEDPATTAARECREEIGMSAGKLEDLGGFFLAPGYSNEYMHVFLATDLQPDALERDADELIEVVKMPFTQAVAQVHAGEILDAKTLAALHLAGKELGPR